MLAARAGMAVALMGAVNAVATLAGCLPAVIWWACHRPNRLWWRFTAWWLLALALAMTWWVVALLLLGRVSPPFLDFIESSGVTTQWTSLTEMLRGTDSWTPFVAPNATAGTSLVTGRWRSWPPAWSRRAGWPGWRCRGMPARGRLVTMLLIGVVLLGVGYSGGLGSPLAHQVQVFLDAAGAPLRNVHKLEPVIRIPLVLGVAQLLSRIPLPGSAPPTGVAARLRPSRARQAGGGRHRGADRAGGRHLDGLDGPAHPAGHVQRDTAVLARGRRLAGRAQRPGRPTPGRVLVVPGAPFATQVWGTSHDEPLQVLGGSPWGVRDSIPLTPPQTIRALDSVQRLFAAGRPSAGLADTLARQGISYVVVRNDLDPETSRSARPILVHRAIDGSPRLAKVAQFGEPVGPGTLPGFVTDSGLRPRYPAVEIYHVAHWGSLGDPGAPYFVDTDQLARVDGGPEVLLRLDERRRLLGQPPLGPAAADRGRPQRRVANVSAPASPSPTPRWPARPTTAASTTTRRRPGPPAMPGTPLTACPITRSRAPTRCSAVGPAAGSPRRVRHRIRPRCPMSRRPPRQRPRSTATRRPRGCPTHCKPPSGSGCRWTSTIR